jgi:hypothetical protein
VRKHPISIALSNRVLEKIDKEALKQKRSNLKSNARPINELKFFYTIKNWVYAGDFSIYRGFDVTAAQNSRGCSFDVLQKASNPALRRDFDLLLDYLRKNVCPVLFDGEDCRLVEMQFK